MRGARRVVSAALALAVVGCGDLPPIADHQTGFRGTGMALIQDQGELEERVDSVAGAIPPLPDPPPAGEPAPPGTWQNVQVLTDVSEAEFFWLMNAMTRWVSSEQGCAYCHVPTEQGLNLVSDDNYAKIASRRMIQMTRAINDDWSAHVSEDGVNCYTCHRGQPVPPAGVWYFTGRNQADRYFLDRPDIRVQELTALAENAENRSSLKQTEMAYEVMLTMSDGLGVNCTHCHQSSRFGDWEESTAARVTALRGARMTRELNQEWLVPLQSEWPPERLGPQGDGPKLQCATCHQGAYQPLYGHPAIHAEPSLRSRDVASPPDTTGGDGAGDGGAGPTADGTAGAAAPAP